jgi:RNA-directed DNA polymerase
VTRVSAVSARSTREAEGLDKVRALQWVLYRSAKSDPARRFHALYGHLARSEVLWRAWGDVRANQGAAGVDGVRIADVEASGVTEFLDEISAALTGQTYRPARLRRVMIPKPGKPGQFRPLGIPTVRDRVVMAAAKLVLEPIFEADFSPVSFGFRPNRSASMACEVIRVEANRGREWVLDADVRDCFGSIDHDALMAQVSRRVSDRAMRKLLASWLRVGVLVDGVTTESGSGTPQGSPISPLMANIALNVLDQEWARRGHRLGVLVRYADDTVVLCGTADRAEQARLLMAEILGTLGLQLHPDKTGIVHLAGGRAGFDFLGWHHCKVASVRRRGRFYLHRWPSSRAMNSIRERIRQLTSVAHVGQPVDEVASALSRTLRGWGGYFRTGNSARQFRAIDSYAHERMAIFTSAKHKRSGRNWGTRYNYAWYRRLGVHRLSGTITWHKTHA